MEISVNQNNITQEVKIATNLDNSKKTQIKEEEGLLDFSAMFKKNGFAKRPMLKLGADRKTQPQAPNWLLQIPAKLQITNEHLEQRRFMNQEKWMMMSKTSSPKQSPLAAVLSSVNYLIKKNSSQAVALLIQSELKDQFRKSDVLTTTQLSRRQTIFAYIKFIKQEKKIELKMEVYELVEEGKNKEFLANIMEGLKDEKKAFIYVSYGHVFCPIGFDNTPLVPLDAYKKVNDINPQKMELWFILASTSKTQAPFIIKRWTDIEKQMTARWPQYLDLQDAKKGVQTSDPNMKQDENYKLEVSCWIQLTLIKSDS